MLALDLSEKTNAYSKFCTEGRFSNLRRRFAACRVGAQIDFPIGYVSRGGTYAFISLIEQHKLLEQEGIRPTFVYIGGPQVSQALISGGIKMALSPPQVQFVRQRTAPISDSLVGLLTKK